MNLADAKIDDIRLFVSRVTELAIKDESNYSKNRSGKEILSIIGGHYRIFHRKMATGIYNNVRRTISIAKREREHEPS